MSNLKNIETYLMSNPLQRGAGTFLIGDSLYSIYDGIRHHDGIKPHLSRAARLLTGIGYGFLYNPEKFPLLQKLVGAALIVDGVISFYYEHRVKWREQKHLRPLRGARTALGVLLLLYPL